MNRLLIVSNRLPIKVQKVKDTFTVKKNIGGLATGLGSFYKDYNSSWIGWPEISHSIQENDKEKIESKLLDLNCYPVDLAKQDVDFYYEGFSNSTIWPLFHYFIQYAEFHKDWWDSYVRVNSVFLKKIQEIAKKDDIIWVHDYHLMLLPQLIRKVLPTATIGFFLHIPFPSFEIFRLLPWRKEILNGLLGADLIGFHTYDYVRHFASSVHRLMGIEPKLGRFAVSNRLVHVDCFPMGIHYQRFVDLSYKEKTLRELQKVRKKVGDKKIILSVDRMDYTKGIVQRLEAFDEFLNKYKEYHEKVTFILIVSPSRSAIKDYMSLKRDIDRHVGTINGKYGTIGWVPLWYLNRSVSEHNLIALYRCADVALITPQRDGMNLIAKEYIATNVEKKGVLILSETAGAANELSEAIIVNMNNLDEISNAIYRALEMPKEEQIRRNVLLHQRIKRYDVITWAHDFIDNLKTIKNDEKVMYPTYLTENHEKDILFSYKKSKRRLFLLDYDGTLVHFYDDPDDATPPQKIIECLLTLARNPKNTVVIISGRTKESLSNFFKDHTIHLVAEHGAWTKENGKWNILESKSYEWKDQIRPIIERFVDRTPGSFLEEKEFSLAWHHRKSVPELSEVRRRELVELLMILTANFQTQVLEGDKVVEIRDSHINKGIAASKYINSIHPDFILAIGDDYTDEDLFSVIPEDGVAIKVGLHRSRAKYNLKTPDEVGDLLCKIAKI